MSSCDRLGWVEVDGQGYTAWHCGSLWAAALRLVELSGTWKDAGEVQALARELSADRDDLGYVAAVQSWVQARIPYVPDPVGWLDGLRAELFRSPGTMLAYPARGGDCDDHARLVLALLKARGLAGQLWFLGTVKEPAHVVSKVTIGVFDLWLETTIPAWCGEHPMSALWRLKGAGRDSL